MGKTKMDERGRILIPSEEREKLSLKAGTEFELIEKSGVLLLKPIIPKPIRVQSKKKKWGREAFLDAGEATFGE
jgi:AbrB family looped-hinge helix DNA binding protein